MINWDLIAHGFWFSFGFLGGLGSLLLVVVAVLAIAAFISVLVGR